MFTPQEYDARLQVFVADLERNTQLSRGGYGVEPDSAAIYAQHEELFTRSVAEYFYDLSFQQPHDHMALLRAQAAIFGHMGQTLAPLADAAQNTLQQAEVEWEGQQVPYFQLYKLIGEETDHARRLQLENLRRGVAAQAQEYFRAYWEEAWELAQTLGFSGYPGMVERLRPMRLGWTADQMAVVLERSEQVWQRVLAERLAAIGVESDQASVADIIYLLRASQFDQLFPAEKMVPALLRTVEAMGLSLDQRRIMLDLVERPTKNPRACCLRIAPNEIWLCIKVQGGVDDFRSFFHEAGHALMWSYMDPDLPFVAVWEWGDPGVAEGLGSYPWESLIYNPDWLLWALGGEVQGWLEFVSFCNFQELFMLRRYAAKLAYELEFQRGVMADPGSLYHQILSSATGVEYGAEYAFQDIDPWFYAAGYSRAWFLNAVLAQILVKSHGENWFLDQRAGQTLAWFWQRGLSWTAEELAQALSISFNAQALLDQLGLE